MPVTVDATPLASVEDGQAQTQSRALGGRLRTASFEYTNETGGTLAAGSKIRLVKLPANKVRINGALSVIKTSALGAARVGKIGHEAYKGLDFVTVVEDDDALALALDFATAGKHNIDNNIADAATYLQIESSNGVVLFLTLTGGTIPNGATIKGEIVYLTD